MKVLVVTNPFDGREVGDVISDPADIEAVLKGERSGHVILSHHAEKPAAGRPKADETPHPSK